MVQTVSFEQDARETIKRGISQLARTVRSTLGPRGRNVILEKSFGPPTVTKDGVTVANEIELEDKYENVGLKIVRQAASKTSDSAGDGTTTATVLAEAIFLEGLKVMTAGVKPVELIFGMQKCVKDIVEYLSAHSIVVKGRKEMAQVASIAANNDPVIGECISDAIKKVGEDGVVTIEVGNALSTEVEWVHGMRFDRGYLSPYFVTSPERMDCVLENPFILILEKKLSIIKDILPLLERVAEFGKPLLIIAEDVEGEALTMLVINQLRGSLECCAIKAPEYGDRRKAVLEDIAILTGGTALMEDLGTNLDKLTLDQLGRAKKVVIDKDHTTIIEGASKNDLIKNRITQINRDREKSTNEYDREQLQGRMAKLSGGVAKISVGGATETEVKQKKMWFEDALCATRAATEEGVVAGGGVALLRAAAACKPSGLSHDETAGYNIIRRACRAPLHWIAANAGQPGSVVVEHVLEGTGQYGYNAATDVYEDLVKAGVIDAAKVVRCALENASSVATLLLTSSAVIAETNHKEKADG